MPAMPWWAMLFVVLVLPLLQPVTQFGADKVQKTLGLNQPQQVQNNVQPANQQRPYVVYHNGQWWKFENNQWYVWRQQQ